MLDQLLIACYIVGILIEIAVRVPRDKERRKNQITVDRVDRLERTLLGLLFAGMLFLPLIYALTPWLSFADYDLPVWAGLLGIVVEVLALLLFWRAHADLKANWSPSLQIRDQHELVTAGVYHYIRHPMYASQWLLGLAQVLLIQNWVAGLGGLLLFLPMYLLRVPREEQMMLDAFGETYRAYMRRTGRVFPMLRG
ncbi:MAG TPA: protein-S-isoprenylcysteine O-methyltransferase [Roseiflexaceae bacterium]|nr:protein-S-isoprenylcysteine O-methyltransferase [Roseiflexaceae bacterium]